MSAAPGEQIAYSVYRGGFRQNPPPHWNDLKPWIRDAIKVAYLQGRLSEGFQMRDDAVVPPTSPEDRARYGRLAAQADECTEVPDASTKDYFGTAADARLRAALQAMVDAWDMSGDEGYHRRIWDEAKAALTVETMAQKPAADLVDEVLAADSVDAANRLNARITAAAEVEPVNVQDFMDPNADDDTAAFQAAVNAAVETDQLEAWKRDSQDARAMLYAAQQEIITLKSAAENESTGTHEYMRGYVDGGRETKAATVERCAQIADSFGAYDTEPAKIAAAIRAFEGQAMTDREITIHTPLVPAWELDAKQAEIISLRTELERTRSLCDSISERNVLLIKLNSELLVILEKIASVGSGAAASLARSAIDTLRLLDAAVPAQVCVVCGKDATIGLCEKTEGFHRT